MSTSIYDEALFSEKTIGEFFDGLLATQPDWPFIMYPDRNLCSLLNVLGGLDQADFGEMIVNGRSTKGFTAHDWQKYAFYL